MWGCTSASGAARQVSHRQKRDKAQNRAITGPIKRDPTRKVWVSRFDDQFIRLADSFGLTPEEFERKLKVERGIAKLAHKYA